MKKKITTLVMCFIGLSTFSQNVPIDSANFAPHKDYYIMPSSFGEHGREGCAPFIPYYQWFSRSDRYSFCNNVYTNFAVWGITQPYITDTMVVIRGVAFYGIDQCSTIIIELWDSDRQVIASDSLSTEDYIPYTNSHIPNYYEVFFNEPIRVIDNYYVSVSGLSVLFLVDSNCHSNKIPLVCNPNTQTWEPFNDSGYDYIEAIFNANNNVSSVQDYDFMDTYIFPIYQPVTIIPPSDTTNNDTSSLIEISNIHSSLYPNPAKDVLNITSNENMQRVQVFNMMGQMIREEEVDGSSVRIDTKGLRRGSYIAKILFNQGVHTKKFVVE